MNIAGFFRNTKLEFIDKQLEGGDIYTFHFKPAKPLKHLAGQHGLFVLPNFGGLHIFSLSSAPEEEYVSFSTHVRAESKYKQRLAALQPGDKITMWGPVLDFTFKDETEYVFLAQGIGITPFRSMLVHARDKALPVKTTLIHVDASGHTFRNITEHAATYSYFVTNPQEFTETIKGTVNPKAAYYLSGSPRFIKATKKTLRSLGLKRSQIRKDSFLGY